MDGKFIPVCSRARWARDDDESSSGSGGRPRKTGQDRDNNPDEFFRRERKEDAAAAVAVTGATAAASAKSTSFPGPAATSVSSRVTRELINLRQREKKLLDYGRTLLREKEAAEMMASHLRDEFKGEVNQMEEKIKFLEGEVRNGKKETTAARELVKYWKNATEDTSLSLFKEKEVIKTFRRNMNELIKFYQGREKENEERRKQAEEHLRAERRRGVETSRRLSGCQATLRKTRERLTEKERDLQVERDVERSFRLDLHRAVARLGMVAAGPTTCSETGGEMASREVLKLLVDAAEDKQGEKKKKELSEVGTQCVIDEEEEEEERDKDAALAAVWGNLSDDSDAPSPSLDLINLLGRLLSSPAFLPQALEYGGTRLEEEEEETDAYARELLGSIQDLFSSAAPTGSIAQPFSCSAAAIWFRSAFALGLAAAGVVDVEATPPPLEYHHRPERCALNRRLAAVLALLERLMAMRQPF